MTKVLASGVVESLNLRSPEGKTYKVADVTVAGKAFSGIFKRPQGLVEGMNVEVVEHPIPAGKKYAEKEIRMASGALPVAPNAAPAAQPYRAGNDQERISRQWATSQAIEFVKLLQVMDALPAKLKTDKTGTLQTQLVGQYANLWYNSVKSDVNFEQLPQFTGQVNEAGPDEQ